MSTRVLPGFKRPQQVEGERNRFATGCATGQVIENKTPPQAQQVKQAISASRAGTGIHTRAIPIDVYGNVVPYGPLNQPVAPVAPVADQQIQGDSRNRLEKEPVTPVADHADWAGGYEDALPSPPDYGDETEHDAWLAGTPIAELRR